MASGADRVVTLDLIRGVAVLGILTVNIAGFAGPSAATLSPHLLHPGSLADEIAFAASILLFEGKMRALFTILFGASLLLFTERMDATGRDGDLLQLRRLGWLLLIGYAHFALLWWGDILFTYAIAGVIALFLRRWPTKALLATALLVFAGWHGQGMASSLPQVMAEEQVRVGTATASQVRDNAALQQAFTQRIASELGEYRQGFGAQIAIKLSERPFWPVHMALLSLGEALPLILLGMVLMRSGFFTGQWPRARLLALASGGIVAGALPTLALLAWAWPRDFPPAAMLAFIQYWGALPHLLMGAGYLALLVLLAPRLETTALGRWLTNAGRVSLSNYIGTSLLMTAIFYGWGLGLVGRVGHASQLPFVLLGWLLMLAWPGPWLARYRQGPLEWLWRSLTERRMLPLKR